MTWMCAGTPHNAPEMHAAHKRKVDPNDCRLFGPAAITVQLLMGMLVIGTLVHKRQCEHPRRPWRTWSLDVSKQLIGQLGIHTLNVMYSHSETQEEGGNPCSLYFANFVLDGTIGIVLLYYLMRWFTYLLSDVLRLHGLVSGIYSVHAPDQPALGPWQCWIRQTLTYLAALLLMKIVVIFVLDRIDVAMMFSEWLLDFFGKHQAMQVVFVMAVFPLFINTFQFWLIDTILSRKPEYQLVLREESV